MHENADYLKDVFTPKLVADRLVEALRWARYNVGPAGPAAVRTLYPAYFPSGEDFDAEGWGLRESADDPTEPPPPRRRLSPKQVSALIDALHWPARYVAAGHPDSARILNLWLRCKVYRRDFSEVITERGEISRATAYRYRDRALGLIAAGLMRDGARP